jgi:hypothetical protein
MRTRPSSSLGLCLGSLAPGVLAVLLGAAPVAAGCGSRTEDALASGGAAGGSGAASGGGAAASGGSGGAAGGSGAAAGGGTGASGGEAAAGPVVRDVGFELRASAPAELVSGQLATLTVGLEATGEFHVNEEFPLAIAVKAPDGLTFPKTEFAKGETAEFGERRARFEVPFTPARAGEHRVEIDVDFAVCTPQNCMPDHRTLAIVLRVR